MKKELASNAAMGSFTDFNVWSVALSEEEMRQFTECGAEMAGDLVPWRSGDWAATPGIAQDEVSLETVEFSALCSPQVTRTIV